MKKIIIKYILLLLFIVIPSKGFANSSFSPCPFKANAKVFFYSSYGKLEYDFTKTSAELTSMFGSPIRGLARKMIGQRTQGKFTRVKYGKGFCVVPIEIKAYIGIGKPVIYVGSEYKPRTCDFNFILRHEQAHMQTSIRMIDQFVTLAPNRLKYAEQHIRPLYIENLSDFQAAYQQILDEYSNIVELMTKKLNQETDKEQEKIDGDSVRLLGYEVCHKHYEKEKKQ